MVPGLAILVVEPLGKPQGVGIVSKTYGETESRPVWPTTWELAATSAFELSRWRGGRYRVVGLSIFAGVRVGSQGGHCDPSQEADAG